MTRKRAWEIGTTVVLLLALVGAGAGAFAWYSRQQRLEADLYLAAREGDVALLQDALARGANVTARAFDGSTPLMVAAQEHRAAAVRALLEAGAKVDDTDQQGTTALSRAVLFAPLRPGKALATVRVLLDHGANVTLGRPSPRQWAAKWKAALKRDPRRYERASGVPSVPGVEVGVVAPAKLAADMHSLVHALLGPERGRSGDAPTLRHHSASAPMS